MRKLYDVRITVTISKEDNEELRRIKDKYGIAFRSFILYQLQKIADKFKGKLTPFNGVSPECIFCREALNAYTPFMRNKNDVIVMNVGAFMPFTCSEIRQKLHDAGILSLSAMTKAIIRTIIRYPELASRCRCSGILCKKYMTPARISNYNNKPIKDRVKIEIDLLEKLDAISKIANTSNNMLVTNVLKLICDMEFNNSCDVIHNANIIKACILESIERNKFSVYGKLGIYVSDIKYSVQILALIEKYGIPGKQELYTRVVRFIIDSANGGIQLIDEAIEDDEDHNDTMLIRNDYRKEVAYAASRY